MIPQVARRPHVDQGQTIMARGSLRSSKLCVSLLLLGSSLRIPLSSTSMPAKKEACWVRKPFSIVMLQAARMS